MDKFDIADFKANPGKYELFRTAQFAQDWDTFKEGEHVAIEYMFNAQEDVIQGDIVPVYRVIDKHGLEADLFANAFRNFVL